MIFASNFTLVCRQSPIHTLASSPIPQLPQQHTQYFIQSGPRISQSNSFFSGNQLQSPRCYQPEHLRIQSIPRTNSAANSSSSSNIVHSFGPPISHFPTGRSPSPHNRSPSPCYADAQRMGYDMNMNLVMRSGSPAPMQQPFVQTTHKQVGNGMHMQLNQRHPSPGRIQGMVTSSSPRISSSPHMAEASNSHHHRCQSPVMSQNLFSPVNSTPTNVQRDMQMAKKHMQDVEMYRQSLPSPREAAVQQPMPALQQQQQQPSTNFHSSAPPRNDSNASPAMTPRLESNTSTTVPAPRLDSSATAMARHEGSISRASSSTSRHEIVSQCVQQAPQQHKSDASLRTSLSRDHSLSLSQHERRVRKPDYPEEKRGPDAMHMHAFAQHASFEMTPANVDTVVGISISSKISEIALHTSDMIHHSPVMERSLPHESYNNKSWSASPVGTNGEGDPVIAALRSRRVCTNSSRDSGTSSVSRTGSAPEVASSDMLDNTWAHRKQPWPELRNSMWSGHSSIQTSMHSGKGEILSMTADKSDVDVWQHSGRYHQQQSKSAQNTSREIVQAKDNGGQNHGAQGSLFERVNMVARGGASTVEACLTLGDSATSSTDLVQRAMSDKELAQYREDIEIRLFGGCDESRLSPVSLYVFMLPQ
jgi:hypothetical protein